MDAGLVGQLSVVVLCGMEWHMRISNVMTYVGRINKYFKGVPGFKGIDQLVIGFCNLPGENAVLI
ncbi:hypothetical protein D3C87_1750300 [compost metagenome]